MDIEFAVPDMEKFGVCLRAERVLKKIEAKE